ncbi:MAG: 2-C-methyl-D-erythritol 4-phosphate cytidylyltransferase, partial [Gammaproteobacteria bacterium]|nr:2-C-methyl-D-erythritol 4-phosphate cytidylyltransferase [Gammaproteobacteria bacterium]
MSPNHRFWAVVPAAGAGLRFGGDLPKQYALLAGKPVLAHSLTALANTPCISRIVVALDPQDKRYAALQLPAGVTPQTVAGGSSRAASVFNALQVLQASADANDWVLVHDAARPLLTTKMLTAMIDNLSSDPVGGILAQ